jgi:hypothetical protein
MIDPEAFDRAAMLDACTRLMAPVFAQEPTAPSEQPHDARGSRNPEG